MPGNKVPVEVCSYNDDWNSHEVNYKGADSVSSRSSSPKSLTESWASSPISVSEASESPEGSIISDSEIEIDRIANDLDNMKITEIQAEQMMKEGADMRHVLQAAYKLKPKSAGKSKFKKGTKLNGNAVLGLLNFDNYKEKEDRQEQKQRMSRAWAEYEQRQAKGKRGPPPGFNSIDHAIVKKFNDEPEEPNFLVSYANGTNTLSLATDPIIVHDVTVSCVVDTCRVFIQDMKNPTFEGLKHLETELMSTYEIEQPKPLLRPIAQGSVLGVFSDGKWYRCQVVSYDGKDDTCDVKFVDHGGYTTVPAVDLRQLKSDYLRLPFQAIETYLAHVNPADEELQKDLASDILFHANVSIKLLGQADDGIPMIQAYYYDGDYIKIFTQEVLDVCKATAAITNASDSVSDASSDEELPTTTPSPENLTEDYEQNTTYPISYYCPETVYPHYSFAEIPQPTIAYCYDTPQGTQQVYYVAGPYIIPTVPLTEEQTVPEEKDSGSDLSFGWSSEDVDQEKADAVIEPVDKPFEEWSQEDYARYYGL